MKHGISQKNSSKSELLLSNINTIFCESRVIKRDSTSLTREATHMSS